MEFHEWSDRYLAIRYVTSFLLTPYKISFLLASTHNPYVANPSIRFTVSTIPFQHAYCSQSGYLYIARFST